MNLHWDGTVTLGSVLIIVSMIGTAVVGWNAFTTRLTILETTLRTHAGAMSSHSDRLDIHEGRILELVGHVQRLIGLSEGWNGHTERRR